MIDTECHCAVRMMIDDVGNCAVCGGTQHIRMGWNLEEEEDW